VAFETIADAISKGAQLPTSTAYSPPNQTFPVIEFIPARFAPGPQAKRTVMPIMEVRLENIRGELHASRTVLPLILAWSMTIHKAQGQSLERVKVDLNKVFADGQLRRRSGITSQLMCSRPNVRCNFPSGLHGRVGDTGVQREEVRRLHEACIADLADAY
jgi:hypothetical protein